MIPITSGRIEAQQMHAALALIYSQRAMDLAELAKAVRADHKLRRLVIERACQEFGLPWLRVEDAIVLLGRESLCSLLFVRAWPNLNTHQLLPTTDAASFRRTFNRRFKGKPHESN